ncbi:hypothetical protein [Mycolicibacterium mengxianglii]|nr:hypothetical protein [Mycolicibacterium mengxianglii]
MRTSRPGRGGVKSRHTPHREFVAADGPIPNFGPDAVLHYVAV